VSRKNAEPLGSMLPLPLQFLAARLGVWFAHALLVVLGKELGRKLLAKVATIAAPDTILRWHRELVANKYDGSKQRGSGRPPKAEELVELVLKIALENEGWGYTRVNGALKDLGYTIGPMTTDR